MVCLRTAFGIMHLGFLHTAVSASSIVSKCHGFGIIRQPTARLFVQLRSTSTTAALNQRIPHLDQSSSTSTSSATRHQESPSTSTSATSKHDPAVLQPLPRPLGVSNPPSSEPESWSEIREKLLDKDRHMAKRRSLCVCVCVWRGDYQADVEIGLGLG